MLDCELRLQAILDATQLGTWVLDLETGHIQLDDQARRHCGCCRPSLTLADVMANVYPADRFRVRRQLAVGRRARGESHLFPFELRIQIPGAAMRRILFSPLLHTPPTRPVTSARHLFGTSQDVSDARRTIAELESSQKRLRALMDHQEQVREQERTRIAREIHDELGQSLTALKMELNWLGQSLRPEQVTLRNRSEDMVRRINDTMVTVRRIGHELRPPVLDTLGLAAAIETLVADFRKRLGIRCNVSVPLHPIDVHPALATSLYRMTQELLTNVARHAQASRVDVTLRRKADRLELEVADNGRGIRQCGAAHHSLGLVGIHERAEQLGGEVAIATLPAITGTRVTVVVPCQAGVGERP